MSGQGPAIERPGLVGRLNRAADRHRLLTILVVAILVSSPGYLRQEFTISHNSSTAVQAKQAAVQAQRAIDQANASTDVARKVSCDNQNDVYTRINNDLMLLAAPRPGTTRTPADQARAVAALRPLLIPLRDCTPTGIARFYAQRETG